VDFVQIEMANSEVKRIITVRDVLGRSVVVSGINAGESKVNIDMSSLPSGKYTIDITDNDKIYGSHNLIKSSRPN
jgi:hypothetical protein